ncbi:hypothetical protein Apa02nite_046840 [Actinoplanes palleronii]|uniref:GtrA-like protein domain-containing protein n=2 Tax=Actinoplanes palleronii TaxID=113570 RepID=A0ABQ4BE10_9ACTN|nr:hypothetical protein Apa02nite_046840 [Actinoplanes palleronii]
MPRQLFWFVLVGALSTVLQTIVYISVRDVVAATWASWLALLVVTPVNTEAHRRITFNVTTNAIGRLHVEAGLTSVVVYLANLEVAPYFASIAGPNPSALTESMILALTGSLVGGVRYLVLRTWVFAARRHTSDAPGDPVTIKTGKPRSGTAGAGTRLRPGTPGILATSGLAAASGLAATSGLAAASGTVTDRRARRNTLRRGPGRFRTNAAPLAAGPPAAGPDVLTAETVTPGLSATTSASDHSAGRGITGGLPLAALACLGTMAPIPTARLCLGHAGNGVLNQRPPGRIRAWHRNRRQHLTARS